ncbi:MAG: tetratricopeptide repeat protein [Acidobacteria bacterium]|nr:tetratricopeptide repeat protein [Acidobacteriota bacterium]
MFRALLLTLVLFTFTAAAQTLSPYGSLQDGSIVGSVTSGQSHALGNVRIEVRDMMAGTAVSSTYTNDFGSFELSNLAFGTYEVVATSGLSEAREIVRVRSAQTTVSLHLDGQSSNAQASDRSGRNTVSVNDFKIPKKARDAFRKAEQALQSSKVDEAMTHIAKALEAYPRYAAAMTMRGILKLDKDAAQDAVNDLEQAIQYDPGYPTAYLALAATYNRLSRFDDSIRTVDRGIALSPNSWQGYFELGKAYVGKGDYTTAVKHLNKAEDMAPKDFALVHLVKAHAMLALQDYSTAMLELESYLTKHPQGPDSEAARKTLDEVRSFVAQSNH